jgi:hypothetical protein
MFRHVVMFKWSEGTTDEQKQALRDGLSALPEKITEIRTYRFGDDAGLTPDTFDFVIVADFEDRSGFLAYRDHPDHQAVVVELVRPITAVRAAVQHEWSSALPDDLPA